VRKLRHAFESLLKKGRKRTCLAEDEECSRPAIQAHSLQNAAILEQLIDSTGHVSILEPEQGKIGIYPRGRNQATTFTGVCGPHDTNIFREIEFQTGSIPTQLTAKQLTLFFLRAVLLESWKKQSIVNSLEDIATSIEAGDPARLR